MITWLRALVVASTSTLALSIACSGDDGTEGLTTRPAGTEGGACLPSGGCDVGLSCVNGKCARADASGTGGAVGSGGSGGSGAAGGALGSGGSSAGRGGAGSGGSSTGGSSAGGTSGGGSAGTSSGGTSGSDAGATCNGTHPLLDGGTRFCAPNQCRCEDSDTCYASEQAARCCRGRMRCFSADAGVACEGTHPLVDGGARFCEAQRCYCPGNDACYPASSARLCCGEAVQCR